MASYTPIGPTNGHLILQLQGNTATEHSPSLPQFQALTMQSHVAIILKDFKKYTERIKNNSDNPLHWITPS